MSGRRTFPFGFWIAVAACVLAGVVAVRDSSDLTSSLLMSLVVVVLVWAVLLARFGPEPRRRFFWGFGLAGWAYLVLSYGPLGAQVRKDLVTTVLLDRMNQMPPQLAKDFQAANLWRVDHERWQLVGHALFALFAGVAGGLLASRIGGRAAADHRQESPAEFAPSPTVR